MLMKHSLLLIGSAFLFLTGLRAQPCATATANGSASNAFTNVRNATNSISADKNLNTVVFTHRNNAGTFGGHSGQIRYDISTDGGATWTNDQGVLNPLSVNGTNAARYPQVAIYNPTGNTNPSNAYLSYLAPTVAATWNGYVSGVRQLNGTGNTETYNQPASTQTLIPNSMCKGAPGVEWAIDAVWTGTAYTGFRIFKGVWNGSSDFVWTTNATITPSFNTAYNGLAQVGDYHIAFDPTGQYGWVSILTHLNSGPSAYSFYPVFYRTTDGGNTWSAAMQVDLGQFNCITNNITAGNFASTAFESDLTVDVNGEPHLLTTVCNGNNAYAVYFGLWHHMFEITYHFGLWNAIDIANVNAGRATWGTSPNTATMDNQPMISRSADGTKIFYAWCDNTSYTVGAANTTPNLFSCAYNVTNSMWTNVRDYTSCNGAVAGQVIFPKMAAEALEPSAGTYKMAVMATQMTASDPALAASFRFLNNLTWTNADFTIAQPYANVIINEGSTWLLCPGSTLGLSITGSFNQVAWSTGSVFLSTTVNSPGTYTVSARSGCTVGTDTMVVTGLTAAVTAAASAICPGDSTLLVVAGNAFNYSWNPGGSTNDSVMVQPSSTTTYTMTAGGSGGCTYTVNTTVTVHPQPVVTASASSSAVCYGDSAVLAASGAVSYTWQPLNVSGAAVTVGPPSTTTYTVSGTDANGCVDTAAVTLTINPLPAVLASADTNVICNRDTVMLMATGASTYVWTPSASLDNANTDMPNAFPSATTDYIVMGTDANGCVNSDTVTINVNALPVIVPTAGSPICAGDTAYLSASGAVSYNWMPGNLSGSSVTAFPLPVGVSTYTVTGTDANGCSDTSSVSVTVNELPLITVTGNNTVCAGTQVTLTASGAVSYVWMPANVTTNPYVDAPLVTTTYTVSGTSADGCVGNTIVTVPVNPLPTATLNIVPTQICYDDASLALSGAGQPAGGTFTGPGVSGTSFDPSVAGNGNQSISYIYTDANGCIDTAYDAITVDPCSGIAENAGLISQLYPNPFSSQLVIELNANEANVEVYSDIGQLLSAKQYTGGRMTIETSEWPAGVYLVSVYTAKGRETVRLVKD